MSFPHKRESSVKEYFVYILASKRNGTLYVGMTNDLARRVLEHKQDAKPGFTKRYSVHSLVYYEVSEDVHEIIAREKAMKKWLRKWKLELIEKHNPDWSDLCEEDGTILSLPRD